ncbi:MAG: hypothetical protein GX660_18650 [Clostridiaceae bacterium]|nr:hypothetical protein [Clostridiaceae bacterium]
MSKNTKVNRHMDAFIPYVDIEKPNGTGKLKSFEKSIKISLDKRMPKNSPVMMDTTPVMKVSKKKMRTIKLSPLLLFIRKMTRMAV